ncbi:collagen alpha-1(III) chain-like [Aphelocoma coerulescens]|uniref:collagen alpha-1(III) chain-like n=1 Tax=Aphelocoma coerulescens TaxID=39617 RepID=UPI003604D03A
MLPSASPAPRGRPEAPGRSGSYGVLAEQVKAPPHRNPRGSQLSRLAGEPLPPLSVIPAPPAGRERKADRTGGRPGEAVLAELPGPALPRRGGQGVGHPQASRDNLTTHAYNYYHLYTGPVLWTRVYGTSGSPISSFGSGRSRGASGGRASCIAGQPAPCSPAGGCAAPRQRGCRAGRAAPCPGSGGRLAQLWQRQCRPRQRAPCPHPSCELETGECWKAPAGAVRRAATGVIVSFSTSIHCESCRHSSERTEPAAACELQEISAGGLHKGFARPPVIFYIQS